MPNQSLDLLLAPTELECHPIRKTLGSRPRLAIETCGFGMVASAARTAFLLADLRPRRVILIGIAGTMSPELQIGQAYSFGRVACYGIGSGSEERFSTAAEMGWKHWPGPPEVSDLIGLSADPSDALLLLSCASASGSIGEVHQKIAKYPLAKAEDMEGFGVATACRLTDTPVKIVRGISNQAGNRDKTQWQIHRALQAAIETTQRLLDENG